MLASVIAADDRGRHTARCCHGEGVIDAVSYEGTIPGGAGHGGAGAATGEGGSNVKGGEVQSELTDQRVAAAYGVP